MWQILKKEINAFLDSLTAYIVFLTFLVTIGLLLWVFPDTSMLEYGYADMSSFFYVTPFVFMFLISAITMRSFAEEIKTGTIEIIFTKPIKKWQIIIAKFLACYLLVIFALVPTFLYYISIYQLGNPVGNIDTAAVIGSYIGLILLGGVFTSIGILASSLTNNQVIAFVVAVFLCFFLFSSIDSVASISKWTGKQANFIEQLGLLYHYTSISRGLIDLRNIIYFCSVISTMLLLTNYVLNNKK